MASNKVNSELKDTGYEIFIASVVVLSILNLVLTVLVKDASMDAVLMTMNGIISLILFLDFCFRLSAAESRSEYIFRQYGWADLFASLPLPQLKVLRLFRFGRVMRLLGELGFRRIVRTLVRNRAGSALLTLMFIAILVLEFGSLAMLRIESAYADANIASASDSLWYMIVTMSTVGYGDRFPVSDAGRLLGSVVLIIGVGIFGTLTGYLANAFLRQPKRDEAEAGDPGQLTAAQRRLAELQELREAHEQTLARIDRLIREESA